MKTTRTYRAGLASNLLILGLCVSTISTGYLAFDLNKENKALNQITEYQKFELNNKNLETFNKIEEQLADIGAEERSIVPLIPPKILDPMTQEERIFQEIFLVKELTEDKELEIAELKEEVENKEEQLKNVNALALKQNRNIRKLKTEKRVLLNEIDEIAFVQNTKEMELKEAHMGNSFLNNQIQLKDYEIEADKKVIEAQSDALIKKDKMINSVYFTVGSKKELLENDIIEKRGGLFGIRAVKVIKNQLEPDHFTRINRKDFKLIPVNAVDVEIVSNHDPDSYDVITDIEDKVWIKIEDPELFWEHTKYLVIATK